MTDVLVLGGTAWLGRHIVQAALDRGANVTCLARGDAGTVPDGADLVRADRSGPDAYESVRNRDWDAVVDVARQPGMVRDAVEALADRAAHWSFVSSCSVYAADDVIGADETAPLHEPLDADEGTDEQYGPAKSRCEQLVTTALSDRALIARAGLIGGPGDTSDRFGYWVSRFALAGSGPVLVPHSTTLATQTIDVRDLAAWIADAPARRIAGPINAVGIRSTFPELIERAAAVAEFTGTIVQAEPDWLVDQHVEPWSGPRSLPLWLPLPEYAGHGGRDDTRAVASGLERRPVEDMLRDTLDDERARGLDRPRAAGLTRAEELDLLTRL